MVVLVCEDREPNIPLYIADSVVLLPLAFVPKDENPIAAATTESSRLLSMMFKFTCVL